MSTNTLTKHVLKMLKHLNKYPIPDLQMVRDFKWFVNKYDKFYTQDDIYNSVNDVIFSGLSFSNTFTTITVGNNITGLNSPGDPVSDMYLSMPDVVFNSNRVVGISIELTASSNLQPNDTIQIVEKNEDNIITTLDTIDIGTIQSSNPYLFGWTYVNMQDDIYSVNPDTYDITPNISFYRQLEIAAGEITGAGEYEFTVTYFLA
jgi:hypothetical protein